MVFVATLFFWHRQTPTSGAHVQKIAISPTSIDTRRIHSPKTILFHNQLYAYSTFQTDASHVSLIPNYSDRKDSAAIMSASNCDQAINGGFYDASNKPLGLLEIEGNVIQPKIISSLVNGFFSISRENVVSIGEQVPDSDMRIALQTGPILIAEEKPLELNILNDEYARRMVAAVTSDQKILFITIYKDDSTFYGPLLSQVPQILAAIAKIELLPIVYAINLDGGSASVFNNKTVKLGELTPIGSLFCVSAKGVQ